MPAADVYRSLWRHRLLIVVLTVLAGTAAYFYSWSRPAVYEATSLVRIQQVATSPGDAYGSVSSLELGQRLAQTYARIVKTRTMKNRVQRELPARVGKDTFSIDAHPVGDVELLELSGSSGDAVIAALAANAVAVSLKQFITETGTLRDQIVVVDRATAPDTPAAPRPKTAAAVAILLALLLNCALALLLDFFSDRLPEIDEFEEKLGRPVLATVPSLSLKWQPKVMRPASLAPAHRSTPPTPRDPTPAPWPAHGATEGGTRGR